jgi:hypothetical protein
VKAFRRFLGPLVILVTLSLAGFAQPLLDKARAQDMSSPGTEPRASSTALPYTSSSIGTEDGGYINPEQAKGVGPVDQSAPLDFSTQPKSVPHVYIPGKLYNVQVDTQYDYAGLVGQMTYQASALGVQCSYCHNVANFAYDTPTKKVAREMLIMTSKIQHEWVDPVKKDFPNYAVNGAVGCITCHRGQPRMGVSYNIVPVQYLDYRFKSVAKSLGVNCLFCHNSADFITLQYYPTNQIAHRMWRMVDAINHQYLTASVKAVTCYTCHQGAKWPQALVTAGLNQTPVEALAAHPEVHENPGAHLASGAQL